MQTNTTKAKLAGGDVVFGAIITRYAPDLVEIFGAVGYDFVMIDCEHGPMNLDQVEHMVRAAESFGITPIARIPNSEESTILRFLDRGLQGIIVPHVNSGEQAAGVARSARYFPDGRRGMGGGRAHDYGVGVTRDESTNWVNSQLLVIPMVEEVEAVNNLDQILAVPGADVSARGRLRPGPEHGIPARVGGAPGDGRGDPPGAGRRQERGRGRQQPGRRRWGGRVYQAGRQLCYRVFPGVDAPGRRGFPQAGGRGAGGLAQAALSTKRSSEWGYLARISDRLGVSVSLCEGKNNKNGGKIMPDTTLKREQIKAAMDAMMAKALETPDAPVAMAIVDSTGNLEAYAKMDNLRLFSRRHALRKAYTAAIMGTDTGANAERMHSQGRSISEMGDPNLTHGQGGLVIIKDGVILGGIGVGGYPSGQADEDLSRVGLEALGL